MLEVHPHYEAAHSWKDFFIHLGTITIGLLLALLSYGTRHTGFWPPSR